MNPEIVKSRNGFMVKCPDCGKERYYAYRYLAIEVLASKTLCKVCVHGGKKCYLYGRRLSSEEKDRIRKSKIGVKHTDSHKKKISESCKTRYLSADAKKQTSELTKMAMHRPEVRQRHIEGLHHSKWLKVRTDKGQLELLEKWNHLGFEFEANYQIHTESDLFYVDGYDKTHNVVLEYDSKYHHKANQFQRDILRQQRIIDILHPKKFWRYNSITKQWKNVIGE